MRDRPNADKSLLSYFKVPKLTNKWCATNTNKERFFLLNRCTNLNFNVVFFASKI